MTRARTEGHIFLAGLMGSIWLANWLITHWGAIRFDPAGPWLIPVWPGWMAPDGMTVYAPSGVLAIGLSFTLRDLVQRRLGWRMTFGAIVAGAALSAMLDPRLALASGLTFFVAETLDLAVYTPLQQNHLIVATIGSNIVGLVADSVIFLAIAFGSLDLLAGQVIGKLWMTLIALPLVMVIRWWDARRGMLAHDDALALGGAV